MLHSLSPARNPAISCSDKERARHCIWLRVNTWIASQPRVLPFPGALSTPPDVETCAPNSGILDPSRPPDRLGPNSESWFVTSCLPVSCSECPIRAMTFSLAVCHLFKEKDSIDWESPSCRIADR